MVCTLTDLHVQSVHHSVPHASVVLFAPHVPKVIFLCKADLWGAILRVGFSTVRPVLLHVRRVGAVDSRALLAKVGIIWWEMYA